MPRFILVLLLCLLAVPVLAAEDKKADDADPPTVSDLLVQARELFKEGKRDEAFKLTTKAEGIDPKNLNIYVLRASMHDQMKQYEKAVADYTKVLELEPDAVGVFQRRGEANFKSGKIKESIADFDVYLKANPDSVPHHWQRGLSYYYAGEFKKGVEQFEVHKTVNPEDVENAVWHYLCKAKIDGVEKAREGLIEIKADGRKWAMPVYEMYRGKMTPEEVLAKSIEGTKDEGRLTNDQFYAHLYIGLFYEAAGKADFAKKHIDLANKFGSDHYMGDVARVHAMLLKKPQDKKEKADAGPALPSHVGAGLVAKRVVYVIDASGAMKNSFPALIRALQESLAVLDEGKVSAFHVIVYNEDGVLEWPPQGLKVNREDHRRKAGAWLASSNSKIEVRGKANPAPAINLSCLYGAERVVLISGGLTDNGVANLTDDSVVAAVKEANKRKSKFDTIQWGGNDPAKLDTTPRSALERLAEETGGTFKYVDTDAEAKK